MHYWKHDFKIQHPVWVSEIFQGYMMIYKQVYIFLQTNSFNSHCPLNDHIVLVTILSLMKNDKLLHKFRVISVVDNDIGKMVKGPANVLLQSWTSV